MDVFDYYLEKQNDLNWVEEYQSTSDKKSGKTFLYTNTNFRTLFAFTDVFAKFLEYNNRPRSEWQTYDNGETMAKHWTVRMQQSKLFRLDNDRYSLTAKGLAFKDLVDNSYAFSQSEIWILVYFLVLNSYFGYKPNYIVNRSQEVFECLRKAGIRTSDIVMSLEHVLTRPDSFRIDDVFRTDAFWYLTFFKDIDFLTLYTISSENSKKMLFDYVSAERTNPISDDLIGHKYKASGQYNVAMILDDMRVLYVTHELLSKENNNPMQLFDNICSIVERFAFVDREPIDMFFRNHYDVFEVIFNEAILNEDIDEEINKEEVTIDDSENEIKQFDETTTSSKQILRNTRAILKRMAKDRAQHKCELECLFSCRYFTSKEDGYNYLEIHHLIPFEFNNEFENSVEQLDNYVALCPSCHRLLHHGVDRERAAALRYLFNSRKNQLMASGLCVDLGKLFEFYGVEE